MRLFSGDLGVLWRVSFLVILALAACRVDGDKSRRDHPDGDGDVDSDGDTDSDTDTDSDADNDGCASLCVPGEYECGDDGCGGSCGLCPDGEFCSGHRCVGDCEPDCEGRECGEDGCGGSCGSCSYDEACIDFVCQGCEPACYEAECGDDGCGGSCGTCPSGTTCVDFTCEGGCEPDCAGRECGDDGCDGSCGSCLSGEICGSGGLRQVGTELCSNDCSYPGDGECDDGGADCLTNLCEFGTDCTDCGPRTEADRLPAGTSCPG